MSSIMKGIVDESEEVAVIYIDGKPSAKYAKKHEAERDAEFMRKRHPNKKIEIKHEVRETEAKKGADGKRCWKGKRYAGTENGKDKCIPVKNEAANPAQQAAIAIAKKKKAKTNEGVIVGHDAQDPEVAVLGGAGTMSLSRLKKKAHGEAMQLMDDIAMGKFKASAYNIKQLANTLNTIVAAEEEMKKLYFGEDTDMRYAAEKTPETNPYGGQKDVQHRGAINETPTDNPTGASGEGGWRKYKPKPAGEVDEGQIYSTGGGAGQSYRKFTPKSAGTFKEGVEEGSEIKIPTEDGITWQDIRLMTGEGKLTKKTVLQAIAVIRKQRKEQLDEKCWDTHKQVGMKKKGDKMVPNCVPKESAIMKGINSKRK